MIRCQLTAGTCRTRLMFGTTIEYFDPEKVKTGFLNFTNICLTKCNQILGVYNG